MSSSETNAGQVVLRGIHFDPHQKTPNGICHQKALKMLIHVYSIVYFFDEEDKQGSLHLGFLYEPTDRGHELFLSAKSSKTLSLESARIGSYPVFSSFILNFKGKRLFFSFCSFIFFPHIFFVTDYFAVLRRI